MASYAAVISLKQTIDHFLKSSHASIPPHTRKILKAVYKEVQSVQQVLTRLDIHGGSRRSESLSVFDAQLTEALRQTQDVLELHASNQSGNSSLHLRELKQDINALIQTMQNTRKDYSRELSNLLTQEDDSEYILSTTDFLGFESKIVGLSEEFHDLRERVVRRISVDADLKHFLLSGMAGIGKTTLAKRIFQDPSVSNLFQLRLWVPIGSGYRLEEILRCIMCQVTGDCETLPQRGLAELVSGILKSKSYLVVLDDIWSHQVWYELKKLFPDNKKGSRVLITTRVHKLLEKSCIHHERLRLLNSEESWCLLRERVFGNREPCPRELEQAGKKIAENCEGLPLTILTVASLIAGQRNKEYWTDVAENRNSVFTEAYDLISDVLLPSYNHLPQHLKACFLYMGVFPRDYEIPRSKLFHLWFAEGLVQSSRSEPAEDLVSEYLEDLVSNSVVMIRQKGSLSHLDLPSHYVIKTCGLHSAFRHLCVREAEGNKFFHIFNLLEDGLVHKTKGHRRLCVHNNVLLGIKDVYNSVGSVPNARSLLCTGPYHHYPVPVCFGRLRLLTVVDALALRFYEFPLEVLKLVQLRYLSLTVNENLPPSISDLRNLEYLIVARHVSIVPSETPSYLPLAIWDMKELKHLQVKGRDLPSPSERGAFLPNLSTLLDVSAHSCTKDVLRRLPNLCKLRIRAEVGSDDALHNNLFSWFNHMYISRLSQLESLKFVIANPLLTRRLPPLFDSPLNLTKLSLSGLGYSWDEMSKIVSLPNLEVLKLQCYAFRGPIWEIKRKGFVELKFLLIEDTDLVDWKIGRGSFQKIRHLCIRNCYKLEKFTPEFGMELNRIELIDCGPVVVANAQQIEEQLKNEHFRYSFDVRVRSSCEARAAKPVT